MDRSVLLFSVLFVCVSARAQIAMNMAGAAPSVAGDMLRHVGSGTDLVPPSSAPPMQMKMAGDWMLMLHGSAVVTEQQQTGPRGNDKFFADNWIMGMAQRQQGSRQLTLRSMLSLEPATISGEYYPELFEQGETAYGKPIVDGQHPHDLFMEIAALFDQQAGDRWVFTVYGGPVGDPALGPEAYPHRASACEDPLAPLSHHLQDSTHIAYDVVTGGFSWAGNRVGVRAEASGFHGREPGENRWTIAAGPVDSWSARMTVVGGRDWVSQYSLGRLHSPEQLHPGEDVLRQTASLMMHRAFGSAALDATAAWGRNHTIGSTEKANGYLAEATASFKGREAVWTRIESADRTTDLLGPEAPTSEGVIGRVQAYTAGYAHRIAHGSAGTVELGAQFTSYTTPGTLVGRYGAQPWGVAGVLRLQIGEDGN